MLKRAIAASVLAMAAIGVGGAASQAHYEGPQCSSATTGVDGAGIWIDGVTGSGTCWGDDFISAENTTPHHGDCTLFLIFIADCTS